MPALVVLEFLPGRWKLFVSFGFLWVLAWYLWDGTCDGPVWKLQVAGGVEKCLSRRFVLHRGRSYVGKKVV